MAGTESKVRRGVKPGHKGHPKILQMPEDLGEQLVAHCASGLSIRAFCAVCGFSWETLQEFRKTNKAFADHYIQAKAELVLHCERQLNEIIDGERSSHVITALKFKMANLIKWSDRVESKSKQKIEQKVTHSFDASSMTLAELDKEIKELEAEIEE